MNFLNKSHSVLMFCSIFLLLLFNKNPLELKTTQEDYYDWSDPIMLFEGEGAVREPIIISDQSGMLHVFWAYFNDSGMSIYYTQWDGSIWSQPTDIISMETTRGPSAAVDAYGNIHLIWHGPLNTLFYSSASVLTATSANKWSLPRVLEDTLAHSQIVVDMDNHLHVVYPKGSGEGPSYIRSENGGETWSAPVQIAQASSNNTLTDFVHLGVSHANVLHVVWTEFETPDGWPPVAIFYCDSHDGGRTWSEPIQMAPRGYLEINIVVANDDEIHVAWNGQAGISGRYHRWSANGGKTWSETTVIAAPELSGGSTGPPVLAVDSTGVVHAVINTRPDEIDATMYQYLEEAQWSEPINISNLAADLNYGRNEESSMAISNGYLLHIVFYNEEKSLWYTSKQTTVPRLLPIPFRSNSIDPSLVPTVPSTLPTRIPVSTPTLTIRPYSSEPVTYPTNPMTLLIIGVIPAVILVVLLVVFNLLGRYRS